MYFDTKNKQECFGCESCQQACPHKAISMKEDIEGFRYPEIDESLCTHCNLCRKVCPYYEMPHKYQENKYIFGGYALDSKIRFNSTSGGAFSVIVETFCKDKNYAIFGAVSNGLDVTHRYITEKKYLKYFRKSKYSQSNINDSYKKAKEFLSMDYQVVFSGTPCQIAGLYAYLKINACNNIKKLLTIEVICEGVPSPLYFRKMDCSLKKKYYSDIKKIDYRYKGRTTFEKIRKLILKKDEKISKHGIGKWDFEIMKITAFRQI